MYKFIDDCIRFYEEHILVVFPEYASKEAIKTVKKLNLKNIVGAEIGTEFGYNAYNIMKVLPIKKLYCIDPYEFHDGYQHHKEASAYNIMMKAQLRLEQFGKKVEFIRKKSKDAIKDIPMLDFIYIDGDHRYKAVKKDLELYYPKVKEGGIVGGHDSYSDEVQRAVMEYVKEKDIDVSKVHFRFRDWYIEK